MNNMFKMEDGTICEDYEDLAGDYPGAPIIVVRDIDQSVGRTRLLPQDSAARKTYPMGTGLLDYFPDALAAVAEVSYVGNQKHNPGEPTHWARGKSMDHADCIIRHFVERGSRDGSGVRHSAQMVWRALALLQEELETEYNLSQPRGAKDAV